MIMAEPICEIEDHEDGIRPVIVQFQNSELQEGEERKLYTGIFRKNNDKTVVAVATKNILYTGDISVDENKNDLYNRFLLVRNRETSQVRLIAVDTAMLTPKFSSKSKDVIDSTSFNANSSINQLNKEFGSKKIKRITEQRERLKMNIDDVKEDLEQTVANVTLNESESLTVENPENESLYRPPINRHASTVEQVYVLNKIIPDHVLDTLEEESANILSSDLDSIQLTPLIKEKMQELQNSSIGGTDNAKLLLYIDYLIKYINKPAKNITKRFILCQSSNEVNSHILDNFSVISNSGRTRPLSMRDKTVCCILVLSMIAFNYELDIEALSKCLKIGVKKLQEMGRILAFSSHGKNKNLMVLKIPLPPAVSISPKKRKR